MTKKIFTIVSVVMFTCLTACTKGGQVDVILKGGYLKTSKKEYSVRQYNRKGYKPSYEHYPMQAGTHATHKDIAMDVKVDFGPLWPRSFLSISYSNAMPENLIIKDFYYTVNNERYDYTYESNPKVVHRECKPSYVCIPTHRASIPHKVSGPLGEIGKIDLRKWAKSGVKPKSHIDIIKPYKNKQYKVVLKFTIDGQPHEFIAKFRVKPDYYYKSSIGFHHI